MVRVISSPLITQIIYKVIQGNKIFFGLWLICFHFFLISDSQALPDSLGIKKIEGKFYILHKLDPGQTFYAVSRKYKINVNDLKSANPDLDFDHIKSGHILKIPFSGNIKEEQLLKNNELSFLTENKKVEEKKDQINSPPPSNISVTLFHVVERGQNLYRISLKYNTTIPQLQEWNKMNDVAISVGQKLIVGYKSENNTKNNTPANSSVSLYPDNKNKTSPKEPFVSSSPAIKINESGLTLKTLTESGIAKIYSDFSGNDKFTALHRSAPLGTIILVKNPLNSNIVYVKVNGKLNESDENVIIKLSQKSSEKLKANDEKFSVELSYVL